jgi:hypothetical protein
MKISQKAGFFLNLFNVMVYINEIGACYCPKTVHNKEEIKCKGDFLNGLVMVYLKR